MPQCAAVSQCLKTMERNGTFIRWLKKVKLPSSISDPYRRGRGRGHFGRGRGRGRGGHGGGGAFEVRRELRRFKNGGQKDFFHSFFQ